METEIWSWHLPLVCAKEAHRFLGLASEDWTALGTVALALLTGGLVVGGIYQVVAIRSENKKSATLTACSAYETNPIIFESLKLLWQARCDGSLQTDPKPYRTQMTMLLNYLDGIAIGIEQGLYIEDLAWDHMDAIVKNHVRNYIDSGIIERADMEKANYRRLLALRDRWSEAKPRFHDGLLSFRWRR